MVKDQGRVAALVPEGRVILHHPGLSAREKGEELLDLLDAFDRAIELEHRRAGVDREAILLHLRRPVEWAYQEFRR
jgi:hypothetical protein